MTGGLALALIERRVTRIENDKLRFEFAFEHAWRRFERRGDFPRIARETGVDPYYQIVTDASTKIRYLPVAIFTRAGSGWELSIRRQDDTLAECIEELEEDAGVPWHDWQKFAGDFMDSYSKD